MATVKLLIAANDFLNITDRGDVVEVVPSTNDWGNKTVAPDWIRLTITNVPGSQEVAEDTLRTYLSSWKDEFLYTMVDGAPSGQQRYRVEITPEIANDFDMSTKQKLKDDIISTFNGNLVGQSKAHVEFDSDEGIPLDEIGNVIAWATFRRFRFPDSLVDTATAGMIDGEPMEFTRTWNWAKNNVIDKLKV